eukprot:403371859
MKVNLDIIDTSTPSSNLLRNTPQILKKNTTDLPSFMRKQENLGANLSVSRLSNQKFFGRRSSAIVSKLGGSPLALGSFRGSIGAQNKVNNQTPLGPAKPQEKTQSVYMKSMYMKNFMTPSQVNNQKIKELDAINQTVVSKFGQTHTRNYKDFIRQASNNSVNLNESTNLHNSHHHHHNHQNHHNHYHSHNNNLNHQQLKEDHQSFNQKALRLNLNTSNLKINHNCTNSQTVKNSSRKISITSGNANNSGQLSRFKLFNVVNQHVMTHAVKSSANGPTPSANNNQTKRTAQVQPKF